MVAWKTGEIVGGELQGVASSIQDQSHFQSQLFTTLFSPIVSFLCYLKTLTCLHLKQTRLPTTPSLSNNCFLTPPLQEQTPVKSCCPHFSGFPTPFPPPPESFLFPSLNYFPMSSHDVLVAKYNAYLRSLSHLTSEQLSTAPSFLKDFLSLASTTFCISYFSSCSSPVFFACSSSFARLYVFLLGVLVWAFYCSHATLPSCVISLTAYLQLHLHADGCTAYIFSSSISLAPNPYIQMFP